MRMCLALITALFSASAAADVVTLQNGDRLTGSIIHKRDATLLFETAHAGTLSIQWRSIRSLVTDEPVAVMLREGSEISTERLAPASDGHVQLAASNRESPLGSIAYLNPAPEQSGLGVSYRGRASLAATGTDGNSTSRRLYADAEFAARAKNHRYTLRARMNRQREAGLQTASNWRTDGNYDWFLDPRIFRYVRSAFEHDRFKDIDLRSSMGGGYGLQLVENKRTSVSLRGGIDYVVVDHRVAANDDYPALGWGLRASHRLETYDIELFHDQDGFIRIGDGNDITLNSRTGLRAPIAAGMNASIQLNLDWEQEPAPGRKSTDTVLLVGLGYEWH